MEIIREQVQRKNWVLIDFYATWCGPCQTMEPILEQIETFFKMQLHVLRLDVDQHASIVQNFRIKSVPTYMLLQSGKPVWRYSGILSYRDFKDEIERWLKK